MRFKS